MGGGGSGGGTQTVQQTTTVKLPKWAEPYAKELLARAGQLTTMPYAPYPYLPSGYYGGSAGGGREGGGAYSSDMGSMMNFGQPITGEVSPLSREDFLSIMLKYLNDPTSFGQAGYLPASSVPGAGNVPGQTGYPYTPINVIPPAQTTMDPWRRMLLERMGLMGGGQ